MQGAPANQYLQLPEFFDNINATLITQYTNNKPKGSDNFSVSLFVNIYFSTITINST